MLPIRPDVLSGQTTQLQVPGGSLFITVNSDEEGPLECFVQQGKRGQPAQATAEAIGRLISCLLRLEELPPRHDRVTLIIDQLGGIGGGDSVGFGPNRIASVPDGVAKVLRGMEIYDYIEGE